MLTAGCSLTDDGTEGGTGEKGYISGNGQITLLDPDDREDPVELTGQSLEGESLSLEEFRGKAVVVNVWWSACPPCRDEMPELVEASDELSGEAEFLGINIRDNAVESARLFDEQFEVPYPSIFSPDGQALLAFAGTLSPRTIPSTVVLDGKGRIAAAVIGPIPSGSTFVELVRDVASEDVNG